MVTSKGESPREKQQGKALMETRIYKEVSFDASHRLLHYEGKCRNLHGHRWRVEVWLAGEIDERTGILVDFNVIRDVIERWRRGTGGANPGLGVRHVLRRAGL
jgi:hypothetical protein